MTAFARRYPRASLGRQSLAPRVARGVRLALALGLALVVGSCSSHDLLAPFVELNLDGLPTSAVVLDVDVRLGDAMKTPTPSFSSANNPLDRVTISFPADSRGTLFLAVRALDAAACVVATGSVKFALTANLVYPTTISMTATNPTGACQNIMLPLTVTLAGDGLGTVTSMGGTISCGKTCTAQFGPGVLVTLVAQPDAAPTGRAYQFVSWTAPGCQSDPVCTFPLSQATTVTANFRCTGFCPENVPNQTNDLYGIWGWTTNSIVTVGAGGTILQSDGMTFKVVPSGLPATTTLRAIHAPPGSMVGYAAGDSGTIIKTTNAGGSWGNKLTTGTAIQLRGIMAQSDTLVYAVGDNIGTNSPYIKSSDGIAFAPFPTGGVDIAYNAITLLAPNVFFAVGATGQAIVSTNDSPARVMMGGPMNLNGAWGSSATKMYAVGDSSTVLTSTGTVFTTMAAPVAGVKMRGMFGFSANSIYAVGDAGNVWKYDGTSWKVVPSGGGTLNLYSLWGRSETDFYIVGQGGTVLHNRM